jgi:hypothetical protein
MYGQKAGMGVSNEATACPCAARSAYCQARDEFIQSIKENHGHLLRSRSVEQISVPARRAFDSMDQ